MSNLNFRAAEYFGMQREPRTSIRVGSKGCLVVAERGGRMCVAFYDEEFRPRGSYVSLTERQKEKLIEVLS